MEWLKYIIIRRHNKRSIIKTLLLDLNSLKKIPNHPNQVSIQFSLTHVLNKIRVTSPLTELAKIDSYQNKIVKVMVDP